VIATRRRAGNIVCRRRSDSAGSGMGVANHHNRLTSKVISNKY